MIDRSILATTNKIVETANEEILKLIPDNELTFFSADTAISDEHTAVYPTELLNTLSVSGMPPHELNLKKHAIVICIRNFNSKQGLCNGTRLIIQNFKKHAVECEIVSGTHIG